MKKFKHIMILSLILLSIPQTAHAYIDPSTGSMVIQILVAAFAAIGYTVKVYWGKIKTFAGKIFKRNKWV